MREYNSGIFVSDDGVIVTTNKADVGYYEKVVLKTEAKTKLAVPYDNKIWIVYECDSFEDFLSAIHCTVTPDICCHGTKLNEIKRCYSEEQKYYCFASESVDTKYSVGGLNLDKHEGVQILWDSVQRVINGYYDSIKYILSKKSEIDYFCDDSGFTKPI